MHNETRELWYQLCQLATIEQDPDKLLELVREIDRLLAEKEQRLKQRRIQQNAARHKPPAAYPPT